MRSSEKSDDEALALALRLAADARHMQCYCEELRQMTITIPSWNDAVNGDHIKVNRNDRRIRISQGHDIVVLSVDQGRALAHAILTVARATTLPSSGTSARTVTAGGTLATEK